MSNMFNNGNNSGYGNGNPFSSTNQFEQYIQTNKWSVQNLQDALNRYAPPNSRGVYYYNDGDTEYECEIYTDMHGQKSYQVYKRILCTNDVNTMPKEVQDLLVRIKNLEEKLNVQSSTNTNDGTSTL